jgi:hypothetical protein
VDDVEQAVLVCVREPIEDSKWMSFRVVGLVRLKQTDDPSVSWVKEAVLLPACFAVSRDIS